MQDFMIRDMVEAGITVMLCTSAPSQIVVTRTVPTALAAAPCTVTVTVAVPSVSAKSASTTFFMVRAPPRGLSDWLILRGF